MESPSHYGSRWDPRRDSQAYVSVARFQISANGEATHVSFSVLTFSIFFTPSQYGGTSNVRWLLARRRLTTESITIAMVGCPLGEPASFRCFHL